MYDKPTQSQKSYLRHLCRQAGIENPPPKTRVEAKAAIAQLRDHLGLSTARRGGKRHKRKAALTVRHSRDTSAYRLSYGERKATALATTEAELDANLDRAKFHRRPYAPDKTQLDRRTRP